jgi:hypothetical protein
MKKQFIFLTFIALFAASCANDAKETNTGKTDSASQVTTARPMDSAANIMGSDTATTDNRPDLVVPDEGIQLGFNLQKGKTYDYRMVMDMERNAREQAMSTGVDWIYEMNVTEDDGKVKTIAASYKRIAMNMKMGDQKMEFSSDNNSGDAMSPMGMLSNMFAAMKGKTFFLKVNRKGEVVAVEGFEKIGEAIADQMKLDEAKRKQLLSQFNSQFNEGTIKESFAQSFNIFPAKKVKVGDSWEKQSSLKTGRMNVNTTTRYTVKGIKGQTVELLSNAKSTMNGQPVTMYGTYFVDANTGLVKKANIKQEIGGEVKATTKIAISGKAY